MAEKVDLSDYVPISCKVDGKSLYNFDQQSRVLQLSMNSPDLERLVRYMSDLEGVTIEIGNNGKITGISRVESLPNQDEYLMKMGFGERLRYYFTGNLSFRVVGEHQPMEIKTLYEPKKRNH